MDLQIKSKLSQSIRIVGNLGLKIMPKELTRCLLISRAYTSLYPFLNDRVDSYEKMLEMIDVYDNTIIDVGMGPGSIYKTEFAKNNVIIGVDYCLRMLKKAKKLDPSAQVILADAGYLPLVSKSADFCVANQVLKYSSNPQKIIEEMKRLSRKSINYTQGFIIPRTIIEILTDEPEVKS